MGRAPPVCYESENLVHCVGRMMMVGPVGYVDRARPEDYIDLGMLVEDAEPGGVGE